MEFLRVATGFPECPRHRAESTRGRQIADLVIAVAEGTPVADWARQNNVPRRTAFRWARDPKLRARVESSSPAGPRSGRRPLTSNISMVTEGILRARHRRIFGVCPAGRVASGRVGHDGHFQVRVLEDRMTKIEETLDARAAHSPRPR